MTEEKTRKAYRVCPCSAYHVEEIQTWLEDLAAQGLMLEADGIFCGVFSFEKAAPRRAVYRLDVEQKQSGGIFGSYDTPAEDEAELYQKMGWEYLARYGAFRIYRSAENPPRELNTDLTVHAMTISALKKQQRSALLSGLFSLLFYCVLYSASPFRYVFRTTATLGLFFALCTCGWFLYALAMPLKRLLHLRRYEKRLRGGEALTGRRDWRKNAAANYCLRALPIVMSIGVLAGTLSSLARVGESTPISTVTEKMPFATVLDALPGGTFQKANNMGDYNTVTRWSNSVAESFEWNESCYVTDADGNHYFCILRLDYQEAASEWLAEGLERDYYTYDASRYRGKHFEEMDAPELGVDSVRVYNSYGLLYILMREGNRVVHAVVHMDGGRQSNDWHLWAQAMAEKLK